MKKVICIIAGILMLLLTGCAATPRYVPEGFAAAQEHFDEDGFQDYTDFCIYQYDSADKFVENGDYRKITEEDMETIRGYFENFGQWMETENRTDEYLFDDTCISEGDYYHIETKEGKPIGDSKYGKYDDYSLYYFDVDTMTLFYIHNNI